MKIRLRLFRLLSFIFPAVFLFIQPLSAETPTTFTDLKPCKNIEAENDLCIPRLMYAIAQGDFKDVRHIIESGFDVNHAFLFYYWKTPLMHALSSDQPEIAVYLIDRGADVSVTVPLDPLVLARERGYTQIAEIIKSKRNVEKK